MLGLRYGLDAFAAVVGFAFASRLLWHGGLDRLVSARLARGPRPLLALVASAFLLSALLTNDGSLFVTAPLFRDYAAYAGLDPGLAAVLASMAANAGSVLTPFGNPQDLLVYDYLGLDPGRWLRIAAPVAAAMVAPAAFYVVLRPAPPMVAERRARVGAVNAIGAALIAVTAAAATARLEPILYAAAAASVAAALLLRVEKPNARLLALLAVFIFAPTLVHAQLPTPRDPLAAYAALIAYSQVLSNVPAAIAALNAGLADPRVLVAGLNAGGLGSIIASLANLIAAAEIGAGMRSYHRWSLALAAAAWLLTALTLAAT